MRRCPRASNNVSGTQILACHWALPARASNNGCHARQRAAAVTHRPHDSHDSARLPINVARNSPAPLSNFEIGSLIFRGFQGVSQNTLRGITCEIWGGLSCTRGTCGIDGSDGSDGRMQTQSSSGHPQQPTPAAVPTLQTTSAQTTKIQPLWPRWSALWADCRRGPSSPAHSNCRHHHGGRERARG